MFESEGKNSSTGDDTYGFANAWENNVQASVLRLSPSGSDNPDQRGFPAADPTPEEQSDLPYKVELWNHARTSVEVVLAVTANASIGYAAYFAATRDHPDRQITLRFRNTILSRWNFPSH